MVSIDLDPRPEDLLGEVLVARQPILDRHLAVIGHELLYRDVSGSAPLTHEEGVAATATILIEGVIGLGRDLIADGEAAYVNVPASMLLDGSLLDIPSRGLVLEILDDAQDTPELRTAIADHQAAGFAFALDAVVPDDPRLSLTDAVDAVKVDVHASGLRPALGLIGQLSLRDIIVIAEKVEEPAAFDHVIAAGASLVQGFFFTRPRAVRGLRPVGLSQTHFQLLRACSQEEVDLDELEGLIRSDLTLADRFLSLISSAAPRWGELTSVRQGLLVLGSRAVHRWVRLLIMSTIVKDQHPEMMALASVRGRYCEVLAHRHGGGRGLEAFSAGMFSILGPDAVLSEATLAQLPVEGDVRAALAGEDNFLRGLLDIQIAAERADWSRLIARGAGLGFSNTELAAAHVDALTWADQLSSLAGRAGAV